MKEWKHSVNLLFSKSLTRLEHCTYVALFSEDEQMMLANPVLAYRRIW